MTKLENPEKARERIENNLKKGKKTNLEFRSKGTVEDLYNASRIFIDYCSPIKNIGIENRSEERKRFLECRKKDEDFKPEFDFHEYPYHEETFLDLLKQARKAAEQIDKTTTEELGAEKITPQDLQKLFREVFDEFELYVKLCSNVDDRKKWITTALEIWPMVDEEIVEKSRDKLEEGFENRKLEKDLSADDLKHMWENELERLGIEYDVEIRDVDGCFNIPEEKTVVVARGSDKERKYSEQEAKMLTMHELFHAARAYNGYKVSEESKLPPILGFHTPFYDMTEEGGALYREKKTGTSYLEKEFDYHLRLMAAYYTFKGKEFQELVEKLIDLGGTPERSFYLAARNREMLRHHIYKGGYLRDWKNRENTEPLLLGKINPEWAEKLWEEVEANGMISKPPVTEEKLFNYRFDL